MIPDLPQFPNGMIPAFEPLPAGPDPFVPLVDIFPPIYELDYMEPIYSLTVDSNAKRWIETEDEERIRRVITENGFNTRNLYSDFRRALYLIPHRDFSDDFNTIMNIIKPRDPRIENDHLPNLGKKLELLDAISPRWLDIVAPESLRNPSDPLSGRITTYEIENILRLSKFSEGKTWPLPDVYKVYPGIYNVVTIIHDTFVAPNRNAPIGKVSYPHPFLPGFTVVVEKTETDLLIHLPNGTGKAFPEAIATKWLIPMKRERNGTFSRANVTIPSIYLSPSFMTIYLRTMNRLPYIPYRAFQWVLFAARRYDLMNNPEITIMHPIWNEILKMPIHVSHGLPPPPSDSQKFLRLLPNNIQVSLERIRQDLPEKERPLYTFTELVDGGYWEDIFRLLNKMSIIEARLFVLPYLGYRNLTEDGTVIHVTLALLGGLGPSPDRANPHTIPHEIELEDDHLQDIGNLLEIEYLEYDHVKMIEAIHGGYMPTPDPRLKDKAKMWRRYNHLITLELLEDAEVFVGRRKDLKDEWFGRKPARKEIEIARMITPLNFQEVAKYYRMILPFSEPLRYAVLNALRLSNVDTDPSVTDRAILAQRGYHRYYASIHGFHRALEDDDIIVTFTRNPLNDKTSSGISTRDETRLLFSVMRLTRPNGLLHHYEDIGTLLTDDRYTRIRGKVFDLLFEAIDAKYNPTFSPLRTHLYRNMTQEEEDLVDMMYKSQS